MQRVSERASEVNRMGRTSDISEMHGMGGMHKMSGVAWQWVVMREWTRSSWQAVAASAVVARAGKRGQSTGDE